MSEWVSVDDRLPNDGMNVLAKQLNNENIKIAYIKSQYWHEYYEDCVAVEGVIDNSICKVKTNDFDSWLAITHWMPLPEPPK